MFFASDNTSPAAPEVMEALARANTGYEMSYGADAAMARVRASLREIFEAPDAAVYLVATGTAANALSLATLTDPWSAIYCHRDAHIEQDECGAPEFYTGGAKLVVLDGEDAKIPPATLEAALDAGTQSDVHQVQRGVLSLTNVTELGTVYRPNEVATLTRLAKRHGLPCHMDGARFANALVATGATPAEMTWKAGIDALSFGGTKNGLLGAEAVILFDPAKAWEFELRRKRAGHLFSKHRLLSAQMEAYLTDGLWLRLAEQANNAGAALAEGLRIRQRRLVHPTEANMVFAEWDRATHQRLREAGAVYGLWPHTAPEDGAPDELATCRMVCSWSTTADDVATVLDCL